MGRFGSSVVLLTDLAIRNGHTMVTLCKILAEIFTLPWCCVWWCM